MKSTFLKKSGTFILFVGSMFFASKATAQDCPVDMMVFVSYYVPSGSLISSWVCMGSVYDQTCSEGQWLVCRYDNHCDVECKCLAPEDRAAWQKRGHKCSESGDHGNGGNGGSGNGNGHWGGWGFQSDGTNGFDLVDEARVTAISPTSDWSPVSAVISLPQRQTVSVMVFDMTGKLMVTILDSVLERGHHEINWGTVALNPGIYFLVIESGGMVHTRKIGILK